MAEGDDRAVSFDPRTWTEGKVAPPAPAAESERTSDAPSFNPRSWVPETAAPLPREAGHEPLTSYGRAEPEQPEAFSRGKWAAVASGVAIALAGAGIAYCSRVEAPPKQPEAAATPSASIPELDSGPSPIEAGGGHRTLNVPDVGQIRAALINAGLSKAAATEIANRAAASLGDASGEIRLEFQLSPRAGELALDRLEATRLDGAGVLIAAGPEGNLTSERIAAKLQMQTFAASGEMDETSFYTSAVSAGITDSLISDFAKAFSFDFDFQREINPGDRFEAVFQQAVNPAGERVGEPRLIYVSMTTPQKSRRFYRFTARGEKEPGWFDDNGRSTVRDLMRTPVDGARVTSKFGPRMHPIRGFVKQHNGTDFAAPTGTPVYAAGSGVVQVRDSRGAAGNMVRIAHDNGWATHYFHLSAFAPELTVGGRVSQGQVVGLVGTTGGSTGPHLHYEVIIEGVKVDPLTVPTGSGVLLSGPALEAFRKERDRIDLARSQQVG